MSVDDVINIMCESAVINIGVGELYKKILALDRWTNERCGNFE